MIATRSIQYGTNSLRDFRIEQRDEQGRVNLINIGDQQLAKPSPRFWTALCAGYSSHGLSTKLFNLFTHAEVFERLHERLGGSGKDKRRWAIENPGTPSATLLAVTDPGKPLIAYDSIGATLARYNTVKQEYGTGSGIMRSTHTPQHMDDFEVAGDTFGHQYVLETPIDGYGMPLIYLSLLRQVCSNGMIGYAKAFKSEVQLGKGGDDAANPIFTLERTLDSFSNEEGYASLRNRFDAAIRSWASVGETNEVYEIIKRMAERSLFKEPGEHKGGGIDDLAIRRSAAIGGGPALNISAGGEGASLLDSPVNTKIMRAFAQLSGDLCSIYRLTMIDAISKKKQAQLSSRATMYDLLNFLTELSTHFCTEQDGRMLQAKVGDFISHEYDLENTRYDIDGNPVKEDFQDWFNDLSDSDAFEG